MNVPAIKSVVDKAAEIRSEATEGAKTKVDIIGFSDSLMSRFEVAY